MLSFIVWKGCDFMRPVHRIKYNHSCFDMGIVQNVTDETIQAIVPHILKDFTDYNLSVNQGREFLQNLSEALGCQKIGRD